MLTLSDLMNLAFPNTCWRLSMAADHFARHFRKTTRRARR